MNICQIINLKYKNLCLKFFFFIEYKIKIVENSAIDVSWFYIMSTRIGLLNAKVSLTIIVSMHTQYKNRPSVILNISLSQINVVDQLIESPTVNTTESQRGPGSKGN